ncbi:TAXI family TRAP transporter solute-binding subunit [Leucobacter chromiiresistens]|nr:TAXI family TRAP transporter solute-binding subunit [Leucobacter chromiiresistens]
MGAKRAGFGVFGAPTGSGGSGAPTGPGGSGAPTGSGGLAGATGTGRGARVSRRGLLLGGASMWALALAGCAPERTRALALACGEPGGAYLQFGELLADALAARAGTSLDLRVTHGSAENLEMLANGDVDLGLSLADTANESAEPHDLAAIGRVYQNYLQCLVLATSDIASFADLAGRRVSIGAPGSGSSRTTRRLLEAALPAAGVGAPQATELELAAALRALSEGGIDALFWSGGIPTPEITAAASAHPLRVLDLGEAVAPLRAAHPREYLDARIPAGVYGTTRSTATVGISNLLMCRADLARDAARALVDVLVVDATRLVPSGSVGLQYLALDTLIDTGDVPLHPAAMERYRERYR